ncbi:GNAT family N-acetyltransferase [Lederbergia lenta]|uniref:GNAT family acetyltransferase n=1 Tax=Lederbergia lenta TaxID=1467 RepID=A0A2X4W7F4_LEDLE|nr:GNAT family N-acetyltransferase [Lederbergia lenta]MEC2324634.1 GNAT family N-acetyltransferase [Lederbergia lenta]SQI58923.1 GNAT family acetyltransferase [Lederbergia lenta]
MKISQSKDYQLIAKLNKQVHDLHSTLYPSYFKEYNYEEIKDVFKECMKNKSFIFLLVEDNDVAVGYAWIGIRDYTEDAFKKAYNSVYVHQISIDETKQHKGYGSRLMEEVYAIAKNNGIDLIELDYWFDNNVAKEFYQKQGFSPYREFVYKKV